MIILKPISKSGSTPSYEEALPEPTQELCGDQGILMGVGYEGANYLVYRGTYTTDRAGVGQGRWSWLYHGS